MLVVDDDRPIADSLCTILASAGHESLAAYTAFEALLQIPSFRPHLVIADVILPEKTGIDLASELRTSVPKLPKLRRSGVRYDGVLVLASHSHSGSCCKSSAT